MYGAIWLAEEAGRLILEIELQPRANRRPRCARCHRPGPGYDTLAPRRWEFVPLWGIAVVWLIASVVALLICRAQRPAQAFGVLKDELRADLETVKEALK